MASVEELLIRIDASTEQLRREMARADRVVAQGSAGMDRSLAKIDKRFDSLNRVAGLATKAIVGYVGVLSAQRVMSFASQQLAAADAIGKVAEMANLSTGAVQDLRYTFTSLAQVTDGQVDAALRRFNRRLGLAREGAGPAKKAFDSLFGGVDQFADTEQALDAVIQRLAGVEDQSRRAALASAYFGDDAGPFLAAALGKGSAAINQMRRDAHDLGLVLDADIIENADKIRSDFDKTQRILNTAFMRALNAAAPIMLKMAEYSERIARAISPPAEQRLQKELDNLRKIRDDLLAEIDRPRLLRINPFISTDELRAQLNAVNSQMVDLQRQQQELLGGQGGLDGKPFGPIVIADPAALAQLKQQVADQQQLNAALFQGADAYQAMAEEIERRNATAQFTAALSEDEKHFGDAYLATYQQLQQLRAAEDEHNKLLAQAKQVQESLLGPMDKYNQQLDLLDTLLEKNLISWEQYSLAVAGATNELDDFGKTDHISDRLKQIEMAVHGFGRNFEDALIDAAKGGEDAFSRMTEAILEDIARLVIRMQVVKPMIDAISSRFGVTANADGNVYQRGEVVPFASGGIVTGPTLFPMFGGKTGLMGEAGPEAIMPLKRGADGKLGVAAQGGGTVVQVIDQRSGGEQPQVEQSRGPDGRQLIRVLIRDEVQAAISGGALDRTMANTYGLRRRGF